MTQINMVRALLISPYMQTVCEVFATPDLEGMRYALEKTDAMFSGYVECFNLAQKGDHGVDAWLDEESNLSEGRPVFHVGPYTFSGSVLILDNDGEGECTGTNFPGEKLSRSVKWTDLETTGDFTEGREYTMDHPILGKNTPVYEGGKPVYRERA